MTDITMRRGYGISFSVSSPVDMTSGTVVFVARTEQADYAPLLLAFDSETPSAGESSITIDTTSAAVDISDADSLSIPAEFGYYDIYYDSGSDREELQSGTILISGSTVPLAVV